MAAGILVWVLGLTLAGQADSATGVVRGVVVNATHGDQVCAGAEVVLRARVGADFVPVARTRSDALGRFEFRQLDIPPCAVPPDRRPETGHRRTENGERGTDH